MRQAIIRLVVFVALLVVLDRLVYAGAIFLRDHSGHPVEIDLIYDEGGWNPPVVFFGDSRTRRNFDMHEVENLTGLAAYDFGRDGASAEQNLFMLEEYLRNKHHPSVVVFEADPQFLDEGYGRFLKEDFRDHVAVVPDPSELLRQSRPTLQQRASAFARHLAREKRFATEPAAGPMAPLAHATCGRRIGSTISSVRAAGKATALPLLQWR